MFFEIFGKLCAEVGKSPNKIAKELSISSGAVSEWKKGRIPQNATLLKLAQYFGVSVDYLLGKTNMKNDIPEAIPVGDLISLKIIASVRAGYGGTAVAEWFGEKENVPTFMIKGYPPEECVILKVKGDSMYPRLLDGDLIIVHVQASVDPGDTAVVIYNDDEGTVKKVNYVHGEDWVELIPSNPEYPIKRIEGENLEHCRVYGKVIGLLGNI